MWWLDEHPELVTRPNQADKDTSLEDAILSGALLRVFLRPLEGEDKAAARLGHQNEPNYLRQYFKDSKEGRVPGVNLCDVRRPGQAMKQGKPFVRDSSDGLGLERHELSDDDIEDFDTISSHPIERKCRSGSGTDGSLKSAKNIQKKIARLKGEHAHIGLALGNAVYLRVSSRDQELLSELITSEG